MNNKPFRIDKFQYPLNLGIIVTEHGVFCCWLFIESEGHNLCHKCCKSGTIMRLLNVSLHSVNCELCSQCIFDDFATFIIIEKNHLKMCNDHPITYVWSFVTGFAASRAYDFQTYQNFPDRYLKRSTERASFTVQFQTIIFFRFCYVSLCTYECFHSLHHRQTKNNIRRNKTERRLKFEAVVVGYTKNPEKKKPWQNWQTHVISPIEPAHVHVLMWNFLLSFK